MMVPVRARINAISPGVLASARSSIHAMDGVTSSNEILDISMAIAAITVRCAARSVPMNTTDATAHTVSSRETAPAEGTSSQIAYAARMSMNAESLTPV